MDPILAFITNKINLELSKIKAVVHLLNDGATIPFIARYRKEQTGSLDEVDISSIEKEWRKAKEFVKRKEYVLSSISDQGQLSTELEDKIIKCLNEEELEDIYLPFKPKRKTRASKSKELGLEPLAKQIMTQANLDPEVLAKKYINAEVKDEETALSGARDIIAEWISENANLRSSIRNLFKKEAFIVSKLNKKAENDESTSLYKDYFDFEESINKIQAHRVLAIFRAENAGILKVKISINEEKAIAIMDKFFVKSDNLCSKQVQKAIDDSFDRLLAPSIESEIRTSLKEKSDLNSIKVFAENLSQLLFEPPYLAHEMIMGIDPGIRTGSKAVILNNNGDLQEYFTLFIFNDSNKKSEANNLINGIFKKYKIKTIAIGNGTGGRDTYDWIQSLQIPELDIFLVNEAGASIYSASEVAREEFPDLDLTYRGAVSIARRLLDPLSELVKIDPKSIGVGQYQHDVNQNLLKENLDQTVISVVNRVGVNLNTASKHLLQYVSGIGPVLAKNIINYRSEKGKINNRKELLKVKGLGPKAFEQAAGFLRIPESDQQLDNSSVHPERYDLVQKIADDLGVNIKNLIGNQELISKINLQNYIQSDLGLPTLTDIVNELKKPGRDPRGEKNNFKYNDAIKEITDLKVGMVLEGIVNNIAAFGAFVDLGIKENGLIHVSQISNQFISNPAQILKLNQIVKVKILEIDLPRKRISLSMKDL